MAELSQRYPAIGTVGRDRPEIVASTLGTHAGWVGAGVLALDSLAIERTLPTQASAAHV